MTKTTEETLPAVASEGGLETLKRDLMAIGTASEDPTSRMLEWIQAASPEDWDDLWQKLPNLRDNVERVIRLHDFRVAPSNIEGNELGVFLIGDVTWIDSGEHGLLSIGSSMCVAQAVSLKKRGYLPCDLAIIQKQEATKAGFHPIHFRYLGRVVNGQRQG